MKLKWNFSLNKLMHNDKIMIVLSLIIAVILWAVVMDNVGSDSTKTIRVPVDVSLTNPIAQEKGLRVITQSLEQVEVVIEGPYFQLSGVKEEDLEVRVNTSNIFSQGYYELQVEVSRVGTKNFTIAEIKPSLIKLQCDFWEGPKEFAIRTNIQGLSVTDESRYRLGDPQLDASLTGGKITVEGPKSVVDQIAVIEARVSAKEAISDTQVYEAPLVAYDDAGDVVNLEQCVLSHTAVTVTVPVLEYRRVDFQYTLKNLPAAFASREDFVKVTPSFVELWGPPDTIQQYADSIQNLGVFDFDHLLPAYADKTIQLNPPAAIKVMDGTTAVTVDFDLDGFSSRIFNLTLTQNNVEILNQPEGRDVRIPQTLLTGIRICGRESVLDSIQESDLLVTLDMQGSTTVGASLYEARVTVKGRGDVWAYYGDEAAGYELYVTVQ